MRRKPLTLSDFVARLSVEVSEASRSIIDEGKKKQYPFSYNISNIEIEIYGNIVPEETAINFEPIAGEIMTGEKENREKEKAKIGRIRVTFRPSLIEENNLSNSTNEDR